MTKEDDNSSGVAAVILGILSITSVLFTLFAFLAPLAGLMLAVIALFFALSQKKISKNKWASAGLLLSLIGIILNFLIIIWGLSLIIGIAEQYQALCDAAGGCDKIIEYLQSQQANQLAQQYGSQLPTP